MNGINFNLNLRLSRFDAVPLIVFIATKEMNYGTSLCILGEVRSGLSYVDDCQADLAMLRMQSVSANVGREPILTIAAQRTNVSIS